MEFRVCFTTAKYENNIFSLCETSNAFIDAFCYFKIHFHQSGPFELIKTMLKSLHVLLGLSPVWNLYPKGFLASRLIYLLSFTEKPTLKISSVIYFTKQCKQTEPPHRIINSLSRRLTDRPGTRPHIPPDPQPENGIGERRKNIERFEPRRENLYSGLLIRSDTNWAVQPLKKARGLKFQI